MPTSLRDYMLGFSPSPAEIGANYSENPISGPSFPIADLDLEDVAAIREETQTTIEFGYKGLLSQRLVLAGDFWYSRRENMVTPLTVRTPFVTLNTEDVAAYLIPRLQQAQVPLAQAQVIAAGMAQVPLGVISSADVNANGAQLLSTYTNVDDAVDLWGLDLSAQYLVTNEWSLTGSVSLVNRDDFTTKEGERVLLNASKAKASAGATYRNPDSGIDGELRARFVEGFPAESGVYVGTACLPGAPTGVEPCVASSTLLDVSLSHPIPGVRRTTVQISVQNLLGEDYRSFPGVPEVGRLGLLRLRYEF
jgi:iron complex outermembrane receptor protein